MSRGMSAPRIQDLHRLLRHQVGIVSARKYSRFRPPGGFFRTIAMLVRDNQIDMAAPAQFPVSPQAMDRGEVVRFPAKAMFVEAGNGCVNHLRRIEAI